MIVSNRLMTAALHALELQLAADFDTAVKSNQRGDIYLEYTRQVKEIRLALSCYGEDLTVSTAKVLLPGEKV